MSGEEEEIVHREESCCSSSSSIIKSKCPASEPELPVDVLVEILRRLSLSDDRDLIALKTVSKFWNYVISRVRIPMLCPPYPCAPFWGLLCFEDPPPAQDYTHHYRPHNPITNDKFLKLHFVGVGNYSCDVFFRSLVRTEPTIEHHVLSLIPSPVELERDPSDIRDCCNGLILILASQYYYYVGNPITKQRLSIPLNPNHTSTKTIHRSSLVFDPSLSKDPVQFKIVSFIRPVENHPMELDIFCSETWGWSTHVLPLDISLYGTEWLPRSVYFNRALYSLSSAMYLVCIDNIISKTKSTSDLRAWAIELPDRRDQTYCGCIGNSLGSFCYSNRRKEGCLILVWILVLKGVDSEWVLTHSISIKFDIEAPIFYSGGSSERWKQFDLFRPCGFFPNDDAVLIATPKLIFSYHLKTKSTEEYHKPYQWRCNRKTIHLDGNWIFPFFPCLLLLNTHHFRH